MDPVLDQLISMSKTLADPAADLVILGEGNTSALTDDGSFWVKASGTELAGAATDTFVRVASAPILTALRGGALTDEAVKELLKTATVEGTRSPSIETFLHALCLDLDGVSFVGHTHPIAAGGLLAGQRSRELFAGSLFPDQIVVLGTAYVYVPYTDPGLPLALALAEGIRAFLDHEHRVPKVILMENHGVIALGKNAQEVLSITHMLVKTCRIISGSLAAGGPRFLSDANVARIDQRPDELARRRSIQEQG